MGFSQRFMLFRKSYKLQDQIIYQIIWKFSYYLTLDFIRNTLPHVREISFNYVGQSIQVYPKLWSYIILLVW